MSGEKDKPNSPKKKAWDLPENRLASTDEVGNRVYIHPSAVKGKWRLRRNVLQSILLLILVAAPWIKIGGAPLLLLDIEHRRFSIFGITFWAHEAPMLVFVFGSLALFAALMSALFGRVWCGWACPQTVFIEAFFRRVERWIEGDALERRKLDQAPWNLAKILKRGVKWGAFLLMAVLISHNVMALFVSPEHLGEMVRGSPAAHPFAFGVMTFLTGLFLFDFGWFREQFCIIACPYGRMQSFMMDQSTVTVSYDGKRPDCINCYKCVQVCPTGVDIRRGSSQMECIGCTACIDACDDVMEKIHKPKGLIRMDSISALAGGKTKWVRPRIVLYVCLLTVFLSGFSYVLAHRKSFDLIVMRAKDHPYENDKGPAGELWIRNHFHLDLANQSDDPAQLEISIRNPVESLPPVHLVASQNPVPINPEKLVRIQVFIQFDPRWLKPGQEKPMLQIQRKMSDGRVELIEKSLPLTGPYYE